MVRDLLVEQMLVLTRTYERASYATSIVETTDSMILSWDQGWDSNDQQVWGAVDGAYIFCVSSSVMWMTIWLVQRGATSKSAAFEEGDDVDNVETQFGRYRRR